MSATLCAMLLSACSQKVDIKVSGIDYQNLDTTSVPGDDFFKYATGNWITHNPQPAEYPRWGSFVKLGDDNVKQLAELIQGLAAETHPQGTVAQKVGDLYNMAMDSVRRNTEGAAPLKPYLDKVQAIDSREGLLAMLTAEHDNMLFKLGIGTDLKNSTQNIVTIAQGGLSLRNRDYYLSDEPSVVAIREALKQHMVNLFILVGDDESTATAKMKTIMHYETEIAKVSYSMTELRDPESNYHKLTVAELTEQTGRFDWDAYLKAYGYDATTEVNLRQVAPVAKACEYLMTAPLADLKVLYEWLIVSNCAGYLSDDFVAENFAYSQKLSGAKEMKPRWKRAVSLVDGTLGDAVGQMYVEKYFPAANKERMLTLVANLQEALGERIKAQTWMSDSTKAVALDKLSSFYVKIGYPNKWDDLTNLSVDTTKSLLANMIEIGKFYWQLDKEKRYNKPVDREEWHMTPQTVNAYYNPTTNEICFPAGILQPPFFNMEADDAMNYGAIGVVIGHEMTHGFDDKGRQFDKEGNLRVWWSPEDIEAFKIPAEQLVAHFDSLHVLPDLNANGTLCLGENLADHGGLQIAYTALKKVMATQPLTNDGGFTPEQRFFLSYANVWAGVNTEEGIRYLTMTDVHSINFLRVNGTLPHIDAWYEAFDVQPDNALYIPKENRVDIW